MRLILADNRIAHLAEDLIADSFPEMISAGSKWVALALPVFWTGLISSQAHSLVEPTLASNITGEASATRRDVAGSSAS